MFTFLSEDICRHWRQTHILFQTSITPLNLPVPHWDKFKTQAAALRQKKGRRALGKGWGVEVKQWHRVFTTWTTPQNTDRVLDSCGEVGFNMAGPNRPFFFFTWRGLNKRDYSKNLLFLRFCCSKTLQRQGQAVNRDFLVFSCVNRQVSGCGQGQQTSHRNIFPLYLQVPVCCGFV